MHLTNEERLRVSNNMIAYSPGGALRAINSRGLVQFNRMKWTCRALSTCAGKPIGKIAHAHSNNNKTNNTNSNNHATTTTTTATTFFLCCEILYPHALFTKRAIYIFTRLKQLKTHGMLGTFFFVCCFFFFLRGACFFFFVLAVSFSAVSFFVHVFLFFFFHHLHQASG